MTLPDEAIEAAAEGVLEATFGQELPEAPIDLARAALTAALPHIRRQIANEIRAEADDLNQLASGVDQYLNGLRAAARIAEKRTTK